MPVMTCQRCNQAYRVEDQYAGWTVPCPNCGQQARVPQSGYQAQAQPLPGHYASADSAADEEFGWALKPGIMCSIVGIGGFVLPLFGLQFRMLDRIGNAAPILGGVLALAGAGLLFLALKGNPVRALLASGTVVGLAGVAFIVSMVAANLGGNPAAAGNNAPNPRFVVPPGGARPAVDPGRGFLPPAPPPLARQQQAAAAAPGQAIPPIGNVGDPVGAHGAMAPATADKPQERRFELAELDLGEPEIALPRLPSGDETIAVAIGERGAGTAFADAAPEGGWLVGLRIIQGPNWGGAVHGLQPIYQVDGAYVAGRVLGLTDGVSQTILLAKPGFAVSGIRCNVGAVMNALQLEFRKVAGTRFAPEGVYWTDYVGSPGGEPKPAVGSDGDPIVGVEGTYTSDIVSLQLNKLEVFPVPEQPLPLAKGAPRRGPMASEPRDTTFQEQAPEGGLLVGFEVFQGKSWGGAVQAIQPIYQVGDRYVLGERQGPPGGSRTRLLAKAGYAVGGIRVNAGLVMNAIQLEYHRVTERGLNPRDHYASDPVGTPGGSPFALPSAGRPIVGIYGSYKEDMQCLGIVLAGR